MQGTAVFYHPPPFPRKCALAGTRTAHHPANPPRKHFPAPSGREEFTLSTAPVSLA